MEKKVRREDIYSGRVIEVYKDEVELDDHTRSYREIVSHHGGACIALKTKHNTYYMVKQYRYALGDEMLEFCAGKLEKGEDPKDAILRESEEELGYKVENLCELGYMVPTCGYSTEKIYLYYGEAGEYVGEHFDVDERLTTYEFTLEEIKEMIRNNTIHDAKTVCVVAKMELMGLDK